MGSPNFVRNTRLIHKLYSQDLNFCSELRRQVVEEGAYRKLAWIANDTAKSEIFDSFTLLPQNNNWKYSIDSVIGLGSGFTAQLYCKLRTSEKSEQEFHLLK